MTRAVRSWQKLALDELCNAYCQTSIARIGKLIADLLDHIDRRVNLFIAKPERWDSFQETPKDVDDFLVIGRILPGSIGELSFFALPLPDFFKLPVFFASERSVNSKLFEARRRRDDTVLLSLAPFLLPSEDLPGRDFAVGSGGRKSERVRHECGGDGCFVDWCCKKSVLTSDSCFRPSRRNACSQVGEGICIVHIFYRCICL